MKKEVLNMYFFALLMVVCGSQTVNAQLNDAAVSTPAAKPDCPPMIYSNEVTAVLVRESACGDLNDVNIIRTYNGEGCGGTEMGVDMSKYTRYNENKQCPDGLEIVTYKRTNR